MKDLIQETEDSIERRKLGPQNLGRKARKDYVTAQTTKLEEFKALIHLINRDVILRRISKKENLKLKKHQIY